MQSSATIARSVKRNRHAPEPAEGSEREELWLVGAFACVLSLLAFAFFYRHGDILLYGDAVAHLNIARRILDAREPGWDQLGSVWLPLPHLLDAPFLINDSLWRSGVGGSIPSMAAYVVGVAGVFRLIRARASRASAWLASGIYALNPSLLYMQSTAMTESIFLAALVWSVVYFDDFLHGLHDHTAPPVAKANASSTTPLLLNEGRNGAPPIPAWLALERCGACLAAAIFTRYDGWIFAFVVGVCAAGAVLRRCGGQHLRAIVQTGDNRRLLRSTASFLLLLALCPVLWLAHNYKINRHPLDWLNGPYSAKAIERRSSRPGDAPYPGKDHSFVATEYFLKAARMNTGEGAREDWLMAMAAAGVLIALARPRRFGALLLLWIPLPFYGYAVAYGSVPIFVPEWWPFSYYNVRYGLELLPAIAACAGLIPWAFAKLLKAQRNGRWITAVATVALFAIVLLACDSSAWCFSPRWRDHDWPRHWMIPICYREAWVNSRDRVALESQVAGVLSEIPAGSTVLMYTTDYVGALQQAGIHFERVISESSLITWDAALSAPGATADYIVAVGGDPVAEAVRINPRGLTALAILHTLGKPKVTIYRGSRQ